MQGSLQSKWLTIAAWGLGFASLAPLVMIAGVCFVTPIDWHTPLISIAILVGICALLMFTSGWCFRRRDERQGYTGERSPRKME
jgi:hypothetical protein